MVMAFTLSHDYSIVPFRLRNNRGVLPIFYGFALPWLMTVVQAGLAPASRWHAVLWRRRRQRRIFAELRFAQRMRQRRALAQLSDRELRDIGLSRYDAEMELRKPFWRD
jgi:uncharacterized protein YjiS (DUF1127 family)